VEAPAPIADDIANIFETFIREPSYDEIPLQSSESDVRYRLLRKQVFALKQKLPDTSKVHQTGVIPQIPISSSPIFTIAQAYYLALNNSLSSDITSLVTLPLLFGGVMFFILIIGASGLRDKGKESKGPLLTTLASAIFASVVTVITYMAMTLSGGDINPEIFRTFIKELIPDLIRNSMVVGSITFLITGMAALIVKGLSPKDVSKTRLTLFATIIPIFSGGFYYLWQRFHQMSEFAQDIAIDQVKDVFTAERVFATAFGVITYLMLRIISSKERKAGRETRNPWVVRGALAILATAAGFGVYMLLSGQMFQGVALAAVPLITGLEGDDLNNVDVKLKGKKLKLPLAWREWIRGIVVITAWNDNVITIMKRADFLELLYLRSLRDGIDESGIRIILARSFTEEIKENGAIRLPDQVFEWSTIEPGSRLRLQRDGYQITVEKIDAENDTKNRSSQTTSSPLSRSSKSNEEGPNQIWLIALGGDVPNSGNGFLLKLPNRRALLLDIGLTRDKFEFDNDKISPFSRALEEDILIAAIITHAHMDHSGGAPLFHRHYPQVPILTSETTSRILPILWADSVKIKNEDNWKSSVSMNRNAIKHLKRLDPNQWYKIGDDVKIYLSNAGHIHGAVSIFISTPYGNILYSGDTSTASAISLLPNDMISRNKDTDVFILESTNGSRVFEPVGQRQNELIQEVKKTLQQKGSVLIPSFAIGRSTEVVALLKDKMREGKLPRVPIYVDGMARTILDKLKEDITLPQLRGILGRRSLPNQRVKVIVRVFALAHLLNVSLHSIGCF